MCLTRRIRRRVLPRGDRHRLDGGSARKVYEELLAGWSEDDLREAARVAARLVETPEERRPRGDG